MILLLQAPECCDHKVRYHTPLGHLFLIDWPVGQGVKTWWLKIITTMQYSEFPDNPFWGSAWGQTHWHQVLKGYGLSFERLLRWASTRGMGSAENDRYRGKNWAQPGVAMEAKIRFCQRTQDTVWPLSRLSGGRAPCTRVQFQR